MKTFGRSYTHDFYAQAQRIDFDFEEKSLQIGDKHYQLLCSETEDSSALFSMVSISKSLKGREIIYYNHDSPRLHALYQQLLLHLSPTTSFPQFIEALINFTRTIFRNANQARIDAINEAYASHQVKLAGESVSIPAVDLEQFIQAETGWCRHRAMFNWFLLRRLQADGHLPAGRIIHYRTLLTNNRPHAMVLFLNTENNILQVIDSALNHHLQLPTQHGQCVADYSEDFYQEVCNRYLPRFDECDPTQIVEEDENEDVNGRVSMKSSR